jgi:hypothetical protein
MRNQKAQFEEWKNTKYVNINFEFLLGSDDFNEEEYMFGTISDIEVDKLGNIYRLYRSFSPYSKGLINIQ